MELEHYAMWAIRNLNFDLNEVGAKIFLQLNEFEELWNDSYENAQIYKEQTKNYHDKHVLRKEFKEGDKVLIFNSRLKIFLGKLRSQWFGQVIVTSVTPYGAIGVGSKDGQEFKVNGQRLKHYCDQLIDEDEVFHFAVQQPSSFFAYQRCDTAS